MSYLSLLIHINTHFCIIFNMYKSYDMQLLFNSAVQTKWFREAYIPMFSRSSTTFTMQIKQPCIPTVPWFRSSSFQTFEEPPSS